MDTPTDEQLFEAIRRGDNQAFESIYDRYQQRGRLAAWRISHRPDWVDEILNESWCRAFKARTSYNGSRPFLVWFGGILQNVYREQCRKSPTTIGHPADGNGGMGGKIEHLDPATIAAEAELLAALDDCLGRLTGEEVRLVKLRFFEGKTLRAVAKEVSIPESTLREHRLPRIYGTLRTCLEKKGIDISQLSPAQLADVLQYTGED